jgi:phenylalanyl-tRNA synthetase beta chain
MKLPLSWLSAYLSSPPTTELAARLTEIGHMVDGPLQDTPFGSIIPLEIRQNRPDCLSILGLAREIAAAFGLQAPTVPLAALPSDPRPLPPGDDQLLLLRLDGVRLDALPAPMRVQLEQYGQRSIHPLVDLANYVMIELGQPLHIYEMNALDLPTMVVRVGRAGEHLDLLDGTTAALTNDDLVVADRHGALALAGVIGGRASAVERGVNVVVEVGRFRPHLVRRTARQHGILTEAALRSSKLLPSELAVQALGRFLALLRELGDVTTTELWRTPAPPIPATPPIRLALADIERIGGVKVATEQALTILTALGFAVEFVDGGAAISVSTPWWRTDVAHPVDLIEELLRIVGYGQIVPVTLPALPPSAPQASFWDQEEQLRALLCAWGYDEVILDSFLLERARGLAGAEKLVQVVNPPAGIDVLRPTLLPNMLSAARHLPLLASRRRLFEIGHVFQQGADGPEERRAVAWLLLRGTGPESWRESDEPDELYRLKAECLAVLNSLGLRVATEAEDDLPFPFIAGRAVRLLDTERHILGYAGALDHRAYGTTPTQAAYGVEISLPAPVTVELQERLRKPIERVDLSIVLSGQITPAALRQVIAEALDDAMIEVQLIDVYAGDVEAQRPRSVTFRAIYAARRGAPHNVWEQLRTRIEELPGARMRT